MATIAVMFQSGKGQTRVLAELKPCPAFQIRPEFTPPDF